VIAAIIEREGYIPNELARGLTKNTSAMIGVVIPDINNTFFSAVLMGIENEFLKHGCNTFVCNTHGQIRKEKEYIDMLLSRRVAGIIFVGTRPINKDASSHLVDLATRLPVMLINDTIENSDIGYVLTNEEKGMNDAVHYLYDLGHRRIALLNGNQAFTTYRYKLNGYRRAMKELKLSEKVGYIVDTEPYEKGGYEGMKKLRALSVPPTAVVSASDQIAIGAMREVFESGKNVPNDMSVVGFSNIPLSNEIYPRLTTVDQYPQQTGKLTAQLLAAQIENKGTGHEGLRMDTTMVIRASCAPYRDLKA
jgi:LacI family transcriptional regulator